MRSYFTTISLLTVAVALLPLTSAGPQAAQVLEYNIERAYTKFAVPCPASTTCGAADESLVFEVEFTSPDSTGVSTAILDNDPLELEWRAPPDQFQATGSKLVLDTDGAQHEVNYTILTERWLEPNGVAYQHLLFFVNSIDSVSTGALRFTIAAHSTPLTRLHLLHVFPDSLHTLRLDYDFVSVSQSFANMMPDKAGDKMSEKSPPSFDLEAELDMITALEGYAVSLKQEIKAKKKAIKQHLKDHPDHIDLRHLLKECDGLVCAARTIAQHIGDKVGLAADPSLGYAKLRNQQLISFEDESLRPQQASRNNTKSKVPADKHADAIVAEGLNLPLTVTKNTTASEYQTNDLVNSPNPLMRVLALIASLLGLASLYKFIHRRCMSMRKRVERAADLEERRNARAYRKAARRAAMRKRWDNFLAAIICFRQPAEPRRMEDYEEKRALILQDAFLEQLDDLDQAEKGQLMEAEIRELRYAHEIVSGLVRVDQHRRGRMELVGDLPPARVPPPLTPATRSRASTHTLPSYTSESLPDYASRPETLSAESDSLVDFTPARSAGRDRCTTASSGPPSTTSSGRRTRYTPVSSVVESSPRPSVETLRTSERPSKDTLDYRP